MEGSANGGGPGGVSNERVIMLFNEALDMTGSGVADRITDKNSKSN